MVAFLHITDILYHDYRGIVVNTTSITIKPWTTTVAALYTTFHLPIPLICMTVCVSVQ